MSAVATRRIAGFLVLVLVLTSLPARVWLFGACPICGTIHEPVLNIVLGPDPADPTPQNTPADTPDDDPPHDRAVDGCVPPLPFTPTQAASPVVSGLLVAGRVAGEPTPAIVPVPARSLLRPPKA